MTTTNNKDKGDAGEDYVNQLAFKSYLRYWCYPNPIDIDGDKKEICDLLISFRDILLIMSVKNHNYDGDYEKYKRKVIAKSTSQLKGAQRKLFNSQREIFIKHPDRDKELFEPSRYKKIYKITVNVGEQFEHYEFSDEANSKGFINIFNKDTFETIIQELDTIKDFVVYLDEREGILSSGKRIVVNCKEKDLLAEFLTNARKFPINYKADHVEEIILNLSGAWDTYNSSEAAALKRKADKASYFIDHLVQTDILKLPNGEIMARELMNLGRTERRMLSNTLFSLVARYEKQTGILARRYSEYNGIGHLLIYYPPDQNEKTVDWVIQQAMQIYSYKTNFREKEIIALAATNGLKQWKFGMFQAEPPITDEAKKYLDDLIEKFGWFKDMKAYYYEEKEYPNEVDRD